MRTARDSDDKGTASILNQMDEQNYGIVFATNKACQTCEFAHGEAEWSPTGQITPDMCHCLIYEPGDFGLKPRDVAYKGAPCICYVEA